MRFAALSTAVVLGPFGWDLGVPMLCFALCRVFLFLDACLGFSTAGRKLGLVRTWLNLFGI